MLVAWASGFAQTTVTFVAGTDKSSTKTLTKDGVTLKYGNGGSLGNNDYYQCFSGSKFTISSINKIINVEFTCTAENASKYGPGCYKADKGNYTFSSYKGTWKGEANEIVFTAESGQVRMKQIVVTLASTKTATTLTFPQPVINIEEGNEASFTGQTATLTAGETVLNKTITYTKSGDDIFATFNTTTGAATLKTGVYGTATVTATYAGDATYAKAERSYTVTIKNPNVIETTYDFVKSSYNYPRTGTLKNGAIISNKSPVTIVNTKNGTKTSSKFTNDDLRNYKDAVLTINAKEGCLISKITIKGTRINQLNLNGENGIWNDGVWTGSAESVSFTNPGGDNNSVCFETITIEYTAPAPITLSEAADDTDTKIKNNNGKTVDVTLTRTLTAGAWNTICLPFDVTAEQIASVLKSSGNVKEYGSEEASKQTIYFKDAETMVAGKPYLIKPTESATELVFKGVTIKNVGESDRKFGSNYKICGTFGKYAMKTDGTELFLKTDGKFYIPAAGTATMKGFRAYFYNINGSTAGAALNLSFGEATGIDGVAVDAEKNVKVYNVNGQYVGTNLDALPKGLYIVGGKKVLK